MIKLLAFLGLAAAICLGVAIFLIANRNDGPSKAERDRAAGFLTTTHDFQNKLEELRRRRDMAQLQISRFEDRKNSATARLKDLGVKTADDLEESSEAKLAFYEIKDILNSIDKLNQDIKFYDDTIMRLEAALRDKDRQLLMENAGINDKQLQQLRTIIHDVDDRLTSDSSPTASLEVQNILDEILDDGRKKEEVKK